MQGSESIARLRAALDVVVVGQDDAKTALALAWLAREHALLIGPSGCGKSALAEAALAAAGGPAARVAFHRDTRAAELLGEVALVRTLHAGAPGSPDGAERLALRALPGSLARAAYWLLDDLERAPGEALAPLLRMLGEREGPGGPLPLATAIATLQPRAQSRHADPPEPAQLDRFALQVRMRGLALSADATLAATLLAREGGPPPPEETRSDLANLQIDPAGTGSDPNFLSTERKRTPADGSAAAVDAVSLPDSVLADWLALWRRIARLAQGAGAPPPSDRVVSAPGLAVLRAHALLDARSEAARADLRAARFMLAARVPEALLRAAEQLVERSAAGELAPPATTPRAGRALPGSAGRPARQPDARMREVEGGAARPVTTSARHRPEPADVSRLVRALEGHLDRAKAERAPDPGGSPRGARLCAASRTPPTRTPSSALLFIEGRAGPAAPRVYRRERRNAGGALARAARRLGVDGGPRSRAGRARWSPALVRAARAGACAWATSSSTTRPSASPRAARSSTAATGALLALRRAPPRRGPHELRGAAARALAELRAHGRARAPRGAADRRRARARRSRGARASARWPAELGVKVHTVFLGAGRVPRTCSTRSRARREGRASRRGRGRTDA